MRRTFTTFLVAAALAATSILPAAASPAPAPGSATIAEAVVAASEADPPQFTLLLAALDYAQLTGVFTGGGQYTVFAPTDQAFLDLVTSLFPGGIPAEYGGDPFAAIDGELGPDTVKSVLLYHVTEGRRAANSVVPPRMDRSIGTLLGASFSVNRSGQIQTIAGQSVPIAGPNAVSASNGIVHVIDSVLLPIPPQG
jgi:uncharacterized surface protein with fasciclin (FAS1) repeats